MNSIKALIIDDEHLAREIIRGYLNEDEQIEIRATIKDLCTRINALGSMDSDFLKGLTND